MKVYKPKNCNKWSLTFNVNGRRCRLAVSDSKSVTLTASRRVEALINCGGVLDADLRDWVKEVPDRLRDKLIGFGLIDRQWCESVIAKPLTEHLQDFCDYLKANDRKPKYIFQARSSIDRTLAGCSLKAFSDIDGNKVTGFWAELREAGDIGQRTYNYNLRLFKIFTNWLIKKRRVLGLDPMVGYDLITQTEYKKKRRAFTADEERRLIETTVSGQKRFKLTGHERCLVYRLALCTGMRSGEIKKLQKLHFDFDAVPPTVTVEASKGKRTDDLLLTAGVAADMKVYLADREPTDKVFDLCHDLRLMIKADERDAGIEYRDAAGRDLDFHSLRHTFCTNLALAEVHITVAQKMMRHSTVELTANFYTHVLRESEVAAIEALENMTTVRPNPAQVKTNMDKSGQVNYDYSVKTALTA